MPITKTVARTAAVWVRGPKVIKSVIAGTQAPAGQPQGGNPATHSANELNLTQFLGTSWQIVGAAGGGESNTDILLLEEWVFGS